MKIHTEFIYDDKKGTVKIIKQMSETEKETFIEECIELLDKQNKILNPKKKPLIFTCPFCEGKGFVKGKKLKDLDKQLNENMKR